MLSALFSQSWALCMFSEIRECAMMPAQHRIDGRLQVIGLTEAGQ
jgi:hypothetical protein